MKERFALLPTCVRPNPPRVDQCYVPADSLPTIHTSANLAKSLLALMATVCLSACNEHNDSAAQDTGRSFSVIGSLRPKADPEIMRKIHEEELAAERAKQAELERQASGQEYDDPSKRDLPDVNTSPFSPSPEMAGMDASSNQSSTTSASWSSPSSSPVSSGPATNYAMNYGAPSAGFVPPPPAISLSTSAQTMPYGTPPSPDAYANPYAYQYMNPYAQPQAAVAPVSQRAPGSLFGSGGNAREDSGAESESYRRSRPEKNITVITPTGMEARSPYKQRDDLRLLWKGMLVSMQSHYGRDGSDLVKIDVGLPGESSKGSLSISQRQSDSLFKNGAVDKKIVAQVKKSQAELVQSYYRYLYSFNKFSLSQQNIAARKQEMELADSQSEKQRAAADLAQAQNDAEASKDDMRSAQNDLASIAGAQSTRTVIGRVCGVTPSVESLAAAEPAEELVEKASNSIGGFFNSVGSAFGMGKPKAKEAIVEAPQEKSVKNKNGKGKKGQKEIQQIVEQQPEEQTSEKAQAGEEVRSPVVHVASRGAVSFELKDVKTTPRKSILRVSIRNNGGENFSFDVDHLSVAEGNNKLAEAAVNAEFDSTLLEPNQEVTGTITIFGRPWNDKLTVSLSDGGKAIVMHR